MIEIESLSLDQRSIELKEPEELIPFSKESIDFLKKNLLENFNRQEAIQKFADFVLLWEKQASKNKKEIGSRGVLMGVQIFGKVFEVLTGLEGGSSRDLQLAVLDRVKQSIALNHFIQPEFVINSVLEAIDYPIEN